MPDQLLSPEDCALRDAVKEALDARDTAAANVEFAIAKALDAGRMLRRRKGEVEHGEFQKSIERLQLGVSYDTCRRWMKLAERAELIGDRIETAQSVRQAYILAGLLPEPPQNEGTGSGQAGGNSFLTFLTRSTTHLQAFLAQHPISKLKRDEVRSIRERIEPLIKIYESLPAV